MKSRDHLPLYGIGPFYVGSIFILTIIAIVLEWNGFFISGKLSVERKGLIFLGAFFIVYGCILWLMAIFSSKIQANILKGVLVNTGIYQYVRNPIYSSFLFLFSGILCCMNNFWLLILPIFFWIFLTILLKRTEEKDLLDKFGKEYEEYCYSTNRCIPWFPKRR